MFKKSLYLILSLISFYSDAGILASSTRVIFNQNNTDRSLVLVNTNKYPVLVQTWIDKGDPENLTQDKDAPYVVIPPIFRLSESEIKSLKIIYNGHALPADRETLYWINIYETPATPSVPSDKKKIIMSMKTQLKIIYRPAALKDTLPVAMKNVSCNVSGRSTSLTCINNSGHYIFFNSIFVNDKDGFFEAVSGLDMMIEPHSRSEISLVRSAKKNKIDNNKVRLNILKDDGSIYTENLPVIFK